jgi:ankyrin repeat protein
MKRKVNPTKEIYNFCDRMVGAVQAGDLDDVKYLLKNNSNLAKVGEDNKKETSVLEIALNNNDQEITTLLLANGADIDILFLEEEKRDLIVSAIIQGPKANINRGFNTYAGYISILGMEVYNKNISKVTEILNAGADINHYNNCHELGGLLHVSVEHANPEMAKLLLDYGVDSEMKDEKKQTAEEYARARRSNNKKLIKVFDDFREMNEFVEAVCSNDIESSRRLITKNQTLVHSKINKGKADEMSLIEFVVGLGNFDITKLLLENGANANQELSNNDGVLLHLSARNKNSVIYDCLLSYGADQSQIDNAGKRAEEVLKPVDEIDQPVMWVDKLKESKVSEEGCCIIM